MRSSFTFNNHRELEGLHAPFSASKPHWLRYDDKKTINAYVKKKAADMGTILHDWAKKTIDLGIKQPDTDQTLYAYVNDAIGYKMKTEVVLYYSDYHFGTADTISFRKGPNGRFILRIHDLKTGESPVTMEQLEVYAAIFCLEYKVKPSEIDIELRIYQNDRVQYANPTAEDIVPIMDKITHNTKILTKVDDED